ncbi:MAG: extracellular solute-binding protein [Planctomycetota bacterium]
MPSVSVNPTRVEASETSGPYSRMNESEPIARQRRIRRCQSVWTVFLFATALGVYVAGCRKSDSSAVTDDPPNRELRVYCSIDENIGRTILDQFAEKTGLQVSTVFDGEAGKTTGLINRIIQESQVGRPRADVFWSSEIFGTIGLSRRNLLESYSSPQADDIPAQYRDSQHHWTAIALRARVLAFDPKKVNPNEVPKTWRELGDPQFAGQLGFANPLFGTTRGHMAAMFAVWGKDSGRLFLESLRESGCRVVEGNSAAVRAVADGRVRFAATDTDDVWLAQRAGLSVDCVYPDLGDGGTLLIPCTVALVRGGPNPLRARELIDYLVSAEVERKLALSEARHLPVRAGLREELGMVLPSGSTVSYEAVTDAMPDAVHAVQEILLK